ncbi:MAG TPA: phage holin family protein [Patescibacteria group bacterium]|nr:phage holin family protein [Patescibacteria group bacterium]
MNHGVLYRFLVRWFVCGLGLWIAAGLLSSHISFQTSGTRPGGVPLSGLFLALIHSVLRPVVIILSLPAIFFTLGLFMVIINGFTVWLASWLYAPLHVTNFWGAILAGVIIGLVNYLVTAILEMHDK